MTSTTERFWITFILRFAFGFFFLLAAINIFSAGGAHDFGPDWFARNLSGSFSDTWLGEILPDVEITVGDSGPEEEPELADPDAAPEGAAAAAVEKPEPESKGKTISVNPTYFFLYGLPFAFAILSVPILTGIFLRPALRIGAILFVMLGLGKYITSTTDLSTTAHDFFFAFLICVGLYFLSQQERQEEELEAV